MTSATYNGWGPNSFQWPLNRDAIDPSQTELMKALIDMMPPDAPPPAPVAENAAEEFVGVTTDGTPIPGLFGVRDEHFDNTAAVAAADRFLAALGDGASTANLALDVPEWRMWTNGVRSFPEHGVLLDDLRPDQVALALQLVSASLSPKGFEWVRESMRLNDRLGEVVGRHRYPTTLTEYCYRFTVFGRPSRDEPWGWQLAGHHVDVHCFVWGSQIVLTPTLLGAEIEGARLFEPHRSTARSFLDSLRPAQRARAVLYDSMLSRDLPPHLAGIVDGRHRAGSGQDNLVLPYEGIAGSDLTPGQRELLLEMTGPYVAPLPDGPREYRTADISRHLEETWVCWIGGSGEDAPFYYKIHGPTILIEYDNHAGLFLSNPEPEPFHVHTIVRMPNGGDYGKSLLREHYARHHNGEHRQPGDRDPAASPER